MSSFHANIEALHQIKDIYLKQRNKCALRILKGPIYAKKWFR